MSRSWWRHPPTWSEKACPCSRKTWSTTTTCAIPAWPACILWGRKLRLLSDDGQRPAQDVDVPSVVLQSISTEVLMRAALDGMGVAVVPRLLAQEHLARSELVHLLPGWIFARYTVYAALPSGRMLPARTKVFLDFLSERVQELVQQRKLAQCCPGIDTVS